MSAGRDVIIAGHGAEILHGTYVNQQFTTIVVPNDANDALLRRVAAAFNLNQQPADPMSERISFLENALDSIAQRLDNIDNLDIRRKILIPHDLNGLLSLRQEVESRIAAISGESLRNFSWLSEVPTVSGRLTGTRFQREIYGLTSARVPPIPTRFSDGSFRAYYAAEDITAALFEAKLFRERAIGPPHDYVFVSLEFRVDRLLDLRDRKTREFIEAQSPNFFQSLVSKSDQTWSQELGSSLVNEGFDGIVCPSRISVGRNNIVVFPDNMTSNAIIINHLGRAN